MVNEPREMVCTVRDTHRRSVEHRKMSWNTVRYTVGCRGMWCEVDGVPREVDGIFFEFRSSKKSSATTDYYATNYIRC